VAPDAFNSWTVVLEGGVTSMAWAEEVVSDCSGGPCD